MLRIDSRSRFVALGMLLAGLQWVLVATGCNREIPPTTTYKPEIPAGVDLCQMLDEAIDDAYLQRRLNLRDHAAWQIVHGILAFEHDFMIEDHQGQLVPALDYLLNGGEMKGWVLRPSDSTNADGRPGLIAVLDAGSTIGQGHADQWLGYLADCSLPVDQVIKIGARDFSLADLLQQAENDVPFNELREYSWTLMALTTYHPIDYSWTAGDGKNWSIAQLLEIEVNHNLEGSACGGTHRLCGIVMAWQRHKDQQRTLDGAWKAADEKIRQCVALAREFQNADGSFSTNFFTSPGTSHEIKTSLHATGHTFEFVVMASDEEQIQAAWLRRAAVNLCEVLGATSDVSLECGALYHAIRGLTLYRERLFGKRPFPREKLVGAERP